MGQSRWIDDDKIWRKRTPSFPCHEFIVPRNASKQRRWKIINTLLRWWRNDWNCFFAQSFLSSSSVFTEQSQKGMKNTKPFTIVRGNPLWEDNRIPHSCQDWSRQKRLWIVITVLTKIFYCNNIENELKSNHNETAWANFVWLEDILMVLRSDSISWRKTPQNCHNSQMQWPVVNTLCQERRKHRNQKVGSEGTPKLDPYWKLQRCCLHCKYGVEIRITSMNEYNSHSWVRISHGWSKLVTNLNNSEQETSEVQFEEYALKLIASDFACRSKAKAKPQRREPADSSHKNYTYWWKNLDRCWTRRIFALRSCSVEEINSSSSSWKPTSRKRRSDWILENQRPSSEKFPALSSLVWRQVEESHGRRRRKQEKIPVLYWFIRYILYLRALHVHSGHSLIDPSLQD